MYWKIIIKNSVLAIICLIVLSEFTNAESKVSASALFNRAKVDFEQEQYLQSIEKFNTLLDGKIKKDLRKKTYLYLGKAYQNTGQFDDALSVYQIAVEFYPQNTNLLVALGKIYYKFNLLDHAKAVIKKALKISPREADANRYMAYTYEKLGFLTEAVSYYEKALENSSDKTPDLWHNYGICLYKSRRFDKALQAVKIARDFRPKNTSFIFTEAKIHYALKNTDKALKNIKQAYGLNPNSKEIKLTLALWLTDRGDTKTALKIASSVLEKEPDEPLGLWVTAIAYLKEGKVSASLKYLDLAKKTKSLFIAELSGKIIEKLGN